MSKDNKSVPVPSLPSESLTSEGIQPFNPAQMVTCDSCLRANAPTRVNCLYCGSGLPVDPTTANLRKPVLRPLESWEQGYNNILTSTPATQPLQLTDGIIGLAAELLKMESATLAKIISANHALPLARSSTRDEADLVQLRLSGFGIETEIIPDVDLAVSAGPLRVRALEMNDNGLNLYERQDTQLASLLWSEIVLLVAGRLTVKRLESRQEKASRKENRILDASEFFSDETIFDFYTAAPRPFRILAKSFDFSCLGSRKGLLAEENMSTLLALFRERASSALWDDGYNAVKKALEPVWPSERSDHSGGWRRDRPGKLTKGSVTEISNEAQFQKYSRLCHYLTSPSSRKD